MGKREQKAFFNKPPAMLAQEDSAAQQELYKAYELTRAAGSAAPPKARQPGKGGVKRVAQTRSDPEPPKKKQKLNLYNLWTTCVRARLPKPTFLPEGVTPFSWAAKQSGAVSIR